LGTGEKTPIAWLAATAGPGDTALQLWLGDPAGKADSITAYRRLPEDSSGVLRLHIAPEFEGAWVHQLQRDGQILWQELGSGSWDVPGLKPGMYRLRSFLDANQNGALDYPNWWTRTEAELPISDAEPIEVTVGWTVERHWRPGASPVPQTGPDPQERGSASAPLQGEPGPTRR
jgi:hypothetical protein